MPFRLNAMMVQSIDMRAKLLSFLKYHEYHPSTLRTRLRRYLKSFSHSAEHDPTFSLFPISITFAICITLQ
uniref:Uncharacterized protein n=1 Tax=Arundo donax TaxID=35708 RepID=A0A0A9DYI8_ARUDO